MMGFKYNDVNSDFTLKVIKTMPRMIEPLGATTGMRGQFTSKATMKKARFQSTFAWQLFIWLLSDKYPGLVSDYHL